MIIYWVRTIEMETPAKYNLSKKTEVKINRVYIKNAKKYNNVKYLSSFNVNNPTLKIKYPTGKTDIKRDKT